MPAHETVPGKQRLRLWWGLILSAAIFLSALGWQSGWLTPADTTGPPVVSDAGRNEWFGIYQNNEKIGYAHRRLVSTPEGYRLSDDTFMRINMMGMVQEISLATGGTLNADMSLKRFDVRLTSSRFVFNARGTVTDGAVDLEVDGRHMSIPVATPVFLTNTVMDAAAAMTPTPGNTLTVRIFDPAAMAQRPVRVRYVGEAPMTVRGQPVTARHLVLELMGTRQNVWMDASGHVLKEEGPLGMTLLAETSAAATAGVSAAPLQDLTRLVAIAVNGELGDPRQLKSLTLRITGLPSALDIIGGRQEVVNGALILRREKIPPAGDPAEDMPLFLKPSPLVQSDAPEIIAAARKVVGDAATPLEKARRLVAWVYRNVSKQPVLSVPNALEILDKKVGDCNEHAILLAALGRAAGIPTRIEAGLVYMRGRFYYHAWNGFYLGRWITADAVFDQMPADLSHIRLVIGGLERQIDLMGVIGQIAITIEESVYD
ncbi:MAG: transglutaminase-like domain-containing protein [Pseudomonadota bacterium]